MKDNQLDSLVNIAGILVVFFTVITIIAGLCWLTGHSQGCIECRIMNYLFGII